MEKELTILEQWDVSEAHPISGKWMHILINEELFTEIRKKFNIPYSAVGIYDTDVKSIKKVHFFAETKLYSYIRQNFKLVYIDTNIIDAKEVVELKEIAKDDIFNECVIKENIILHITRFEPTAKVDIEDIIQQQLKPYLIGVMDKNFKVDNNTTYTLTIEESNDLFDHIDRYKKQIIINYLIDSLERKIMDNNFDFEDIKQYLKQKNYIDVIMSNREMDVLEILLQFHERLLKECVENENQRTVNTNEFNLNNFLVEFENIKNSKPLTIQKNINQIQKVIMPLIQLEEANNLYKPIIQWAITFDNGTAIVKMADIIVKNLNMESCFNRRSEFELDLEELNSKINYKANLFKEQKSNRQMKTDLKKLKMQRQLLKKEYFEDVVEQVISDSKI